MKIAIFEPNFCIPSANAGSHIILLKQHAHELSKLGHHITIISEKKNYEIEKSDSFEYEFLTGVGSFITKIFYPGSVSVPLFSGFFSTDIILKAIYYLRKNRHDLIYTAGTSFSSIFGAIIGKMSSIPTVHYIYYPSLDWNWWSSGSDEMSGYLHSWKYNVKQFMKNVLREIIKRKFIVHWSVKNINQLIISSNSALEALLIQCNINNVPVLYPGIPLSPSYTKHKTLTSKKIVYFGHIFQGRGVIDLIIAFNQLVKNVDDAQLILAGSNIHQPTLKIINEIIQKSQKGNQIHILGKVKNIYSDLLSDASVIVLPYRDISSIKLLESLSSGRPVITTNCPGWGTDLIENGVNGYLVNRGDITDLIKHIESLLFDPELANRIGINGRNTIIDNCLLEKNIHKLIDIFENVKSK